MDKQNKISESASKSSQPNNADQIYYPGPNNHRSREEIELGLLGHPWPHDNKPFPYDELIVGKKNNLFKKLERQFENGVNANLVVKLGDVEFPCHSEVIQIYSEKFSDLNGIREIIIEMDKCSYDSFLFIYDWMISKDMNSTLEYMNRENVLNLLQGAEYLQINELIEHCMVFIKNKNNFIEHSAYKLFVLAKVKNLNEISDLMLSRIRVDFLLLVSSKNWLELDVEIITDLLQSNNIYVNSEIEVFMAAIRWLRYDWTDRQDNAYEVLKTIRWKHMTAGELKDLCSSTSEFYAEIRCDLNIMKLIREASGWAEVILTNPSNPDRPNDRNWSGAQEVSEKLTYRGFLSFLVNLKKHYLYTLLEHDRFECLKKIIKGDLKEEEI